MRHGAYHFKRLTDARNYNAFNLYLMTSEADVQAGLQIGVKSALAVGFPKLDPAFDGTMTPMYINQMRNRLHLPQNKPVLLFTATYDSSGMSGIAFWYDRLSALTNQYAVLVTLHPWISDTYRQIIKQTEGAWLIEDYDIVPYICLADVCIGDTSSILAECCALDKPMLTWKVERAKRSLDEIEQILDKISHRLQSFDDLFELIPYALHHREELAPQRAQANRVFYDRLAGKAGQRAADAITKLLPELEKDSG